MNEASGPTNEKVVKSLYYPSTFLEVVDAAHSHPQTKPVLDPLL